MTNFTLDQLMQLKAAMQRRHTQLQEEIRSELLNSENGFDINLADDINNIPDNIDTALIDQQINEMRELEVSLKQFMELEFGDCIHCGKEIGFDRLMAYPSTQHCIACQNQYEKPFPYESNLSL